MERDRRLGGLSSHTPQMVAAPPCASREIWKGSYSLLGRLGVVPPQRRAQLPFSLQGTGNAACQDDGIPRRGHIPPSLPPPAKKAQLSWLFMNPAPSVFPGLSTG